MGTGLLQTPEWGLELSLMIMICSAWVKPRSSRYVKYRNYLQFNAWKSRFDMRIAKPAACSGFEFCVGLASYLGVHSYVSRPVDEVVEQL